MTKTLALTPVVVPCRLVGVARVPKVAGDVFLNTFLMLPTDALAIMRAELEFS